MTSGPESSGSAQERNHHLVSNGLLKQFAGEAQGRNGEKTWHQVRQIDVASKTAIPVLVSIRRTWRQRDFNTVWVDGQPDVRLEQAWGDIESECLPAIDAVRAGERGEAVEVAIRSLVALHLARSRSFRYVHDRIWAEQSGRHPEEMDGDVDAHEAFVADHGRPPAPGEIAGLAIEIITDHEKANDVRAARMADTYLQLEDRLSQYRVQFCRVRTPGLAQFVIADVPVVISRWSRLHVGTHRGLAVGDADEIWMPLASDIGISFSMRSPPELLVDPIGAAHLNNLSWRNAMQQVVCHPTFDWRKSGMI